MDPSASGRAVRTTKQTVITSQWNLHGPFSDCTDLAAEEREAEVVEEGEIYFPRVARVASFHT